MTAAEQRKQQKREAILAAAFTVFLEKGFAASTMQAIASRAGVTKGTVYLYFSDKNMLFQEAIRSKASPVFAGMNQQLKATSGNVKQQLHQAFTAFQESITSANMPDVLRLLISEGLAFPQLIEFYFEEFVQPTLAQYQHILLRAAKQGELHNPGICQYPQLVMAPFIMNMLWHNLFKQVDSYTTKDMITVHLDTLFV